MHKRKKGTIKPFVWGIVVGTIVLLIVIFSAGWVVTNLKAEEIAEHAVVDRLVSICVKQFIEYPDKEERLKEFEAKNSWEREDYVK